MSAGEPGAPLPLALERASYSGRALRDYPELVRALARVKRAAARANARAGVLDAPRAAAIDAACLAVERGEHAEALAADPLAGGGGIAIHRNLNDLLARLASAPGLPVDPRAHVAASQSTADVCHTAFRLAAQERHAALDAALAALGASLDGKARELVAVRTIARTCLREGIEESLGELFGGHAALLARRRESVALAARALARVNLGGTVIGSGDGAPPAYRDVVVAELAALVPHPIERRASLRDAAQNGDDLLALVSALGQLATALAKLAQDLRLLSSGPRTGFGEIALPEPPDGSAFFRGKQNPIVPETLIACCCQVLGCERAAQAAAERAELQLHVFEPIVAIHALDAQALLARAVGVFDHHCVRGLRADAERCRQHAAAALPFGPTRPA